MKRIIYDYEKPHIVGKAKGGFSKAKIIVVIIILALLIAVVYTLFFRSSSVTLNCAEFFAVKISGQENVDVTAEQIKLLGGGGYIDDNTIVVCVYPTKQDAQAVADRYGYMVESLGKYKVKIGYSSIDVCNKVAQLCLVPEQIALELYQCVVSLDKGELSEAAAMLALENAVKIAGDSFEQIKDLSIDFPKDKLIEGVFYALEQISYALSEENFYSISSHLKYCLIRVAFIYKNLLISIT